MVKNPLAPVASSASLSARSAVRRARIGPGGGGVSPKRFRSAFENGRSQAKALPRDEPRPVAVPRPLGHLGQTGRPSARRLRTPPCEDAIARVCRSMRPGVAGEHGVGVTAWRRRARHAPDHPSRRVTAGTAARARWTTDPDDGLTGIVLSTRAMTSPAPPVHVVEFWKPPTARWPTDWALRRRPGTLTLRRKGTTRCTRHWWSARTARPPRTRRSRPRRSWPARWARRCTS